MADFPDDRDDSLQGPQVGWKSPLRWPAHEGRFETAQRGGIEPRLATGTASPAQPCRPMCLPRIVPSADSFAGHAESANDLGLPLALGKQLRSALPACFQSGEIPGAKSGRHKGIVAGPQANATILRKHH